MEQRGERQSKQSSDQRRRQRHWKLAECRRRRVLGPRHTLSGRCAVRPQGDLRRKRIAYAKSDAVADAEPHGVAVNVGVDYVFGRSHAVANAVAVEHGIDYGLSRATRARQHGWPQSGAVAI